MCLERGARHGIAALVLALASQPAAFSADSHCKLGRMAELPITMWGQRPLVTAGINGTPVHFLLDSGAFFSTISPGEAAELKLKTHPAPFGLYMQGVAGGRADVSVASVKTFTLPGISLKNVEFLVGGSEIGIGSVGLLGRNILQDIGDVEYDLGNGVVRLMKPIDCRDRVLAYWAGASTPYSVIPIDFPTGVDRYTIGHASVNGAEIRVMFDTGAGGSILSMRAAARAGIKPDSPGVVYAGMSYGVGKTTYPTYIAPFASFKIGDEEIKNTKLRIGDIDLPNADMLIGPDFFLSHHIYVANSQRKLYFTYNGGPVFNLAVKRTVDEAAKLDGGTPQPTQASSSSDQESAQAGAHEQEAAEFSRRGGAEAARGDLANAIADLTKACERAPDTPEYFYQRGLVYQQNKQPDLAAADFDQSLKLKPNDARVLISRARLSVRRGKRALAAADLDSADLAAPKESDLRYQMAEAYYGADLLDAAIKQYDLWIEFHSVDARYPAALNGRCWARAIQGQALPLALKDCNAAERGVRKSTPEFAQILDSRALVLLRMGDYDKSIADYNASLKIDPKNPWGWYGRGIDELRKHKAFEGQADLARAEALWPQVADEFTRRGITP
jgi:tetratricopeptide (TPR) repeat protein/predicted aspartyl protease